MHVTSSQETRLTEWEWQPTSSPDAESRFQRRITERSPHPATSAGHGGPTPGSWSSRFARRSVPLNAFLVTARENGERVRAERSQVSPRLA